jgi:hypothetical protein
VHPTFRFETILENSFMLPLIGIFMLSVTIPDINNADVQELCHSLVREPKPIYVNHQPLPRKPVQECFPIVAQHITEYGGSQVFGWAIIEVPGMWLEAEFHTVWQNKESYLLDVTPRQSAFEKILFLPDPVRKYEGLQVESIFRSLTQHPDVLRFIQLAHEFFVETNRGELALSPSYIRTPRIAAIEAETQQLIRQISLLRA